MEWTDDEKWKQRLLRRKRWLKPLFEQVKPGKIVEFGCGSGFVLEDLSKEFPDSQIVGIDMNQERLDAVAEKNLDNVETMKADITTQIFPDQSIDTILYVGVLHEIFSLSGREKVLETLKLGHKALKDDGILIIQDFLKPPPEPVTISFKNQKTEDIFFRFTREFRIRNIEYEKIKGGVMLDIGDAVEFLTKYRPPSEGDWIEEMGETHHYFTKEDFHEVASEAGFTVKDSIKLLNVEDYFAEIREDIEFDFDENERAWIQLVMEKRM
ncbi:MAG: methyltransferase domain-containing protein [Thermoplasmata archaeon]|nr:methyltransferase domain-containing protein [Thermoplasmata archaeon]